MQAGLLIFDAIFALLGILPDVPSPVRNAVDGVFDIMFSSVSLVSVFVDFNMIKILIPLTIAILNFDRIFKFIIFAIKKIPLINLK
jgi:hypothetical protein